MPAPDQYTSLEEAIEAIEDLLGVIQEFLHKLRVAEDLSAYGVVEQFIEDLEEALDRYDSLE